MMMPAMGPCLRRTSIRGLEVLVQLLVVKFGPSSIEFDELVAWMRHMDAPWAVACHAHKRQKICMPNPQPWQSGKGQSDAAFC